MPFNFGCRATRPATSEPSTATGCWMGHGRKDETNVAVPLIASAAVCNVCRLARLCIT